MKKLNRALWPGLLWAAFLYAAVAFYYLSLDPSDWCEGARYLFSIFGILPTFFIAAICYFYDSE